MSNPSKKFNSRKFANKNEPYFLLSPTYLIMIIFMGYPLINSIIMAFQKYKLTSPATIGQFNGLNNFTEVLQDQDFFLVVQNSIVWVVSCVLLQFLLGFILALALKKPFKGRNIYQAIIFLPWALSSFIVGLSFRWLFNGEYGAINDLLLKGGFISSKLSWLGTPGLSLLTVIVAMVWIGIPFFGIMILAALQSIPDELYEAGSIDGAGAISKFINITVPYIKPTLIMTVLLRTIWIFNAADLIQTMTFGGPANSSHTLSSYMFSKAYSTLNFGQAAAIGVIFMILLMFFVVLFLKRTKYNEAGDF